MNIALTRARTGLIGGCLHRVALQPRTSCRAVSGLPKVDDSGTVMGASGLFRGWMPGCCHGGTTKHRPSLPRPARPVDNHGMHQGVTVEERPQHLPRLPCSHHRTGQPLPRAGQPDQRDARASGPSLADVAVTGPLRAVAGCRTAASGRGGHSRHRDRASMAERLPSSSWGGDPGGHPENASCDRARRLHTGLSPRGRARPMAAIDTVVAGALDRAADGFLTLGQVSERLTAPGAARPAPGPATSACAGERRRDSWLSERPASGTGHPARPGRRRPDR